jgi:type IV pilus assembly protein PilW
MKGREMINRAEGLSMRRAMAHSQGFTLIELLIYIAIVGVVTGSIFTAYQGQLQAHVMQRQIVDMQQNLRAALYLMDREIKLAGYNPSGAPDIGITTAETNRLAFSMDFTGANSPPDFAELQQTVEYALSNDTDDLLRNGDVMALNIDAIDFVYLDEDGDPIVTPVTAENLGRIRSVQVTLVARSGATATAWMRNYVDNRNYVNQQGEEILAAQNDNFRRLMLSTEVQCRNLGL